VVPGRPNNVLLQRRRRPAHLYNQPIARALVDELTNAMPTVTAARDKHW
jgi:hypothetical protein